ncbi:MAG TPA: DNA-directed RNA polymerase subunit omega [Clostridia bacterium]|nr:DNA-directed RNA polymerase subunit omega [Clostridia bacterium]
MKPYNNDQVLERTENKYILSKVIAKRARQLKEEEDIAIGYMAINRAVQTLMEDDFSFKVHPKK